MSSEIGCACPLCDGNCDKCVCRLAESPGEHLSCFERAERIKNNPQLQDMMKKLHGIDFNTKMKIRAD